MNHPSPYRVNHHEKDDFLFQSYHMKYINPFESCLICQSHELLPDFVHYSNSEEKATFLWDKIEPDDFFDCVKRFSVRCLCVVIQ